MFSAGFLIAIVFQVKPRLFCHLERSEAESKDLLRIQIAPHSGKVFPFRIHLFDQRDLFCPDPVLQLFLPGNGVLHIMTAFEIDKLVNIILLCKTSIRSALMFEYSPLQIIGYTSIIDRTNSVGNDIDIIGFIHI